MTTKEILEAQYDILGHKDGEYTEIRIISTGKSYFCKSKEQFVNEANNHISSDAYVGINPRNTESGKYEGIKHLSCLVIDIDPVREKGTPSSDDQHKGALGLGERIARELSGIYVSSGSGCHVYLPVERIEVRNLDALRTSLKNWNDAIKANYGTKELKIDSIFDLPRVIRLWGSHNTRSNRTCGPTEPIGPFTRKNYDFSQEAEQKLSNSVDSVSSNERFNRLCKTNKRLSELLQGNIKHPSRSESDFEFIAILAAAHFTPEEIKELALLNPTGKQSTLSDKEQERQIKMILEKVSYDKDSFSLHKEMGGYSNRLKSRSMGILTGLSSFDEMVSGLKPQKLYIFAARPNEGKTSLITQMLTHIAEQGKTCLFYPTEVGFEPIIDKIVSKKTGLNLKKFQNGSFISEDFTKIDKVKNDVAKLPLIVVEDFGVNIGKIEEGIKKYAPSVLAVDFFQALKWEDPESVAEKAETVRKLKELAGDYSIPVIIASQLNRTDGKSDLRQLKGTGTLEELGDVISFLFTENKLLYPRPVDLVVMKSKYSATGQIKLQFFSSTCEFKEVQNDSSIS